MKKMIVVLLLMSAAFAQNKQKRVSLLQATDKVFAEQCRDDLRRGYESLQSDSLTDDQFAALDKRAKECLAVFKPGSPQAVVAVTLASVERERGRRALNATIDKSSSSYNSLVRDYNALLDNYRAAVNYSYNRPAAREPVVIPQPRQPLSCMALRLGDNIGTLNCY